MKWRPLGRLLSHLLKKRAIRRCASCKLASQQLAPTALGLRLCFAGEWGRNQSADDWQ